MDVNAPHVHVECTRVYVCTPVSKSLLHAVQVHGRQGLHRVATQGRSPYGCGISLHVQAGRSPCEEGSLTQKCHHHLWAARPAPRGEPLSPGCRAGGRGTDQGLQDGVVGGVHAGVQREGALPFTVIG